MRTTFRLLVILLLAVTPLAGCSNANPMQEDPPPADDPPSTAADNEAFLDTLQENTFRWFWETTNAENGLTPRPLARAAVLERRCRRLRAHGLPGGR